mmetsp:Transcript_5146/g.12099  ORF Transcript_5146/g.12099 Transcript_5146/m.12099 type:complete len:220 (+) Transcript_5146:891-1550(+)
MERSPVRIVHVVAVGMHQQVHLETQAQEHPILPREICEERLTIACVADVLNKENIKILGLRFLLRAGIFDVILGFLVIGLALFPILHHSLFLFLLFTVLLLLLLAVPLLRLPPPVGIPPLAVLPAPLLQQPCPLGELLPEPLAWLQVLDPLSQLPLADPNLQILLARFEGLPCTLDLVKALILGGQCETAEVLAELLLREILDQRLAEPEPLLLLRQLH